jgi:hypothetical protein
MCTHKPLPQNKRLLNYNIALLCLLDLTVRHSKSRNILRLCELDLRLKLSKKLYFVVSYGEIISRIGQLTPRIFFSFSRKYTIYAQAVGHLWSDFYGEFVDTTNDPHIFHQSS